MVYETFLNTIQCMVQQKLNGRAQVSLQQVLKNNGLMLDGLTITAPDSKLAPTVYLNAYYDEAEKGLPLSVIADQILLLYETKPGIREELAEEIIHFDSVKDRIVYRLIHADNNRSLLDTIPFIPFLDLAIVFYIILSESEEGQMTSMVRSEHLKLWDISQETLIQTATENTPRLLPARLAPIEETLRQLDSEHLLPEEELPFVYLYVLTNRCGINGAACLLYPDILKNFAEQEDDDLIIIPSSIHEVLITPLSHSMSVDYLNSVIHFINQTEVPKEERLSDHIYCYRRNLGCIQLPSGISAMPFYFSEGETANLQ